MLYVRQALDCVICHEHFTVLLWRWEFDFDESPVAAAIVVWEGPRLEELERIEAWHARSKLPGWHPDHSCGAYCDGQDGNGQCNREKEQGPVVICTTCERRRRTLPAKLTPD